MSCISRSAFASLPLIAGLAVPAPAQDLPRLTLDQSATTVSGLSSGAYMAGQMHLAFSERIAGAALVAGGPYDCADGSVQTAAGPCLEGGDDLPDVAALVARAEAKEAAGAIDPLTGLAGDRVYLFAGTQDSTVAPEVVARAGAAYAALGIDEDALRFVSDVPAGHAFLAPGGPVPCGETTPPFIADCGIDQAGDILAWLYGDLAPPAAPSPDGLITFSQAAYLSDPPAHSMAETGFAYIPEACRAGATCRLHIAFHGCRQGIDDGVIDAPEAAFPTGTGYNRWAEANRIVVLYPQVDAKFLLDFNPRGCWDWWGYDDPDYATRSGPQTAAVARMATALGAPVASAAPSDPICISHEAFNNIHWFEGRAEPCGFGWLCAMGSGDPIGFFFGTSTLYETAPGAFQLAACEG